MDNPYKDFEFIVGDHIVEISNQGVLRLYSSHFTKILSVWNKRNVSTSVNSSLCDYS